MNTLIKARAVFAAVSIVALAAVAAFGGLAADKTGQKFSETELREMIDEGFKRPGFVSMFPGFAEYEEENTKEPEREHGKDEDTYGEDGRDPDSWLGSRYVLGFYVDDEYIHPSSYENMVKYSENISAIAPFWYRLSPGDAGKLQEHHPQEGFTAQEKKRIIDSAHRQNMEVLMLIHNLLYGGKANGKELAKIMLATEESREGFIDGVEANLEKFDYDGINIDIESIYVSDRDRFSALMKELYERLSPKGYSVTVCVPAKTSDNRSNTWSGPFDYKEIAKYSDRVVIMTYDEHGYSSGPGPVASYNWVEKVMKYAAGQIPPGKILMGIPGYGFDWTSGKKGAGYISYSQAVNLSASRGVQIQWDETARVPYFKYRENGRSHQVWFESKYSLEHKLDIAKECNIGGIALWRVGLEDPGMWEVIDRRIEAQK